MSHFNGGAFLETALKLKDGTEADKRSAISRAYYAAFLVAKEFVLSCSSEEVRNDGTDHVTVPRYLQRLKHFQESNKLLKLKNYRHLCDYAQPVIELDVKVTVSIDNAKKLIHKYKAIVAKQR